MIHWVEIVFLVNDEIFFFFNDTATTEIYTLSLRRSSDLEEDEEHVAGADADELGARRHAGVVAARGGPEAGGDAGDVGGVGKGHVWTPVTVKYRKPSSA